MNGKNEGDGRAGGNDPLDIQDYLDATSDAARRTRSASITVVVASVLLFAGLLNSLQNSWMHHRLQASNSIRSKYVAGKIGVAPDLPPTDPEWLAYQNRYKEFYSALIRTYVDSAYVIRVPFFGFRVDANDLGLLGGLAFVVILTILRFCVSREVDNLKTSFVEAERLGRLKDFYVLLAMRQVFTVPASESINRGRFLIWVPKLFCFAPLTVHVAVMLHDFSTLDIGTVLNDTHTSILFGCELLLTLILLALTSMVVTRLRRVDQLWDSYWECVKPQVKGSGRRTNGA